MADTSLMPPAGRGAASADGVTINVGEAQTVMNAGKIVNITSQNNVNKSQQEPWKTEFGEKNCKFGMIELRAWTHICMHRHTDTHTDTDTHTHTHTNTHTQTLNNNDDSHE